eukprot:TRINITY_DN31705_c0_g1_i1.p1 TRINITY_DN31705_c0_g1~~TRINITY_DN31705_c0_g1_i1.p1  ORF type:complete len:453 (+),score=70.13 TRINITY_DN31705_c0_g1_i1:343-1701(+)
MSAGRRSTRETSRAISSRAVRRRPAAVAIEGSGVHLQICANPKMHAKISQSRSANVTALHEWTQAHDRLPRRKAAEPEERRLATFLGAMQQQFCRGTLDDAQVNDLMRIHLMPERFEYWEARKTVPWESRLRQLKDWVLKHNRLPRRYAEGEERTLSAWISSNQQKHRTRKLPKKKVRALCTVPFFRKRLRAWEERVVADDGGQHQRPIRANARPAPSLVSITARMERPNQRPCVSRQQTEHSQQEPDAVQLASSADVSREEVADDEDKKHDEPSAAVVTGNFGCDTSCSSDPPSAAVAIEQQGTVDVDTGGDDACTCEKGAFFSARHRDLPAPERSSWRRPISERAPLSRGQLHVRVLESRVDIFKVVSYRGRDLWSQASRNLACEACGEVFSRKQTVQAGAAGRPRAAQHTVLCRPCFLGKFRDDDLTEKRNAKIREEETEMERIRRKKS